MNKDLGHAFFSYLNEYKIAKRDNTWKFPSRLEQTKGKFKENICLEIFSRNIERFSLKINFMFALRGRLLSELCKFIEEE